MTKINASVFDSLNADGILIARAVELINDQRLTTLEALRQGLNRGTWTIRTATPADKMGDDPAIYIGPKDDGMGNIAKGQIVLRPEDLRRGADPDVLKLIDNLNHEGVGHGDSARVSRRQNAYGELTGAQGNLGATERGDRYVKAMLDDESSARYEGWQFRIQLLGLDTTYKGSNRVYLATDDIYTEFSRLEGVANGLGLKGGDMAAYIVEHARDAMAAFGSRTYPTRLANYVTEVLQIKDTPAGRDYLNHVEESFNVVGYEVTDVVTHDDGSSSGGTIYADGRRVDVVFDPSGNLFQKIDTAANGDKTTTQYFTDGKVSRVVEADGANDNADYASRTTVYDAEGRMDNVATSMDDGSREWVDHDQAEQTYQRIWSNRIDAQGREDWQKIIGDDGSVEWIDIDQLGQTEQRIWSNRTDAQGREDWRKIIGDDGGVEWIDFDQAGQTEQRIWSNYTDAQGREDWQKIIGDDGSVEWIDFDQAGQTEQRIWSNRTDAQGLEDWRRITGDDGSVEWIDYDQANQTEQRIWSNRTDAQGREDWRRITGDDGSVEWIDYDQANQTDQRIWSNYTDAEGREDWCRITGDDGGVAWYDYDQDNTRADRLWSNRTDALGREDWRSIIQDGGRRDWYDYDQDNSQGWSRVESHFDSSGREEFTVLFRDNGSHRYYSYDNQGVFPWSREEFEYDAGLQLRSAIRYYDDGTMYIIY